MSKMESIDRREALKRTSLLMGGALAAPTILSILQGCSARPGLNWEPSFFSESQARLVMQLAEIILPETDTPGAKSLGVPKFIEDVVSLVMNEEQQTKFIANLDSFESECEELMGETFLDLSQEKQMEFFAKKHSEIEGEVESSTSFVNPTFVPGDRPLIWDLKEITLAGYFTTEVGATQVLQHVLIPGEYKACISLEEAGGRSWAMD